MAKKAVAKKTEGNLPEMPSFMQNKAGRGTEGISNSDVEIPRLVLLQSLSDEVNNGDCRPGQFYHNIMEEELGDELTIIPIYSDIRFILWNPRHSGGGILARADDGVHWNPPNQKFEVQPYKDIKKTVTWETKETVEESGLSAWGSSDPENPDSAPAATKMYSTVCWIKERPDLSPCVLTLQRSSVTVARKFMGKLKMIEAPSYGLQFRMTSIVDQNGAGEEFRNYRIETDGFVEDEELFNKCEKLYEQFSEQGLNIADIEGSQEADPQGADYGDGSDV